MSITLVIYQESLHDARSTKCKIKKTLFFRDENRDVADFAPTHPPPLVLLAELRLDKYRVKEDKTCECEV